MQQQSEMLPELPNEVWTLVMGKLESVGDFGRLQQVSRPFHTAIADVGWTKIKSVRSELEWGTPNAVIFVNEQELLLPTDKRMVLVEELAEKAVNITKVSLGFNLYSYKSAQMEEEYVDFLGRALDKLASASLKIHSLDIEDKSGRLSPMFPSLARFIQANTSTMENICFCVNASPEPEVPELQLPPELLQAIRDCAQLRTAYLNFDYGCYSLREGSLNVPLLESVLSGKAHLKKLSVFAEDVPVPVILDSGLQLVELGCYDEFLWSYVVELGHRGLAPTDQHPLRTIKKLVIAWHLPIPSLLVLSNLEHLEFGSMDLNEEVIPLVSGFLTRYKETRGDPKVLTCDTHQFLGVSSAQELANKVQEEFPCQAAVTALADNKSELVFTLGNASIKMIWQ